MKSPVRHSTFWKVLCVGRCRMRLRGVNWLPGYLVSTSAIGRPTCSSFFSLVVRQQVGRLQWLGRSARRPPLTARSIRRSRVILESRSITDGTSVVMGLACQPMRTVWRPFGGCGDVALLPQSSAEDNHRNTVTVSAGGLQCRLRCSGQHSTVMVFGGALSHA